MLSRLRDKTADPKFIIVGDFLRRLRTRRTFTVWHIGRIVRFLSLLILINNWRSFLLTVCYPSLPRRQSFFLYSAGRSPETFSFRENKFSKGSAFLIPSSPVNARPIGRSRLSQKSPIARRQSRALRKTLAQGA